MAGHITHSRPVGSHCSMNAEQLEARMLLTTFYVDTNNPAASDTGPGTIGAPLKTISAALTFAGSNNATSQADTIYIRGGVYREQPNISTADGGASASKRTVISAYPVPGGGYEPVYILASDLIVGTWQRDGTSSRWFLNNFTTQTSEVFSDWSPSNDSAPLKQIGFYASAETSSSRVVTGSGVADMVPGSFYGDESSGRLYVCLPDGSDPNAHQISYANRKHVIYQGGTPLASGGYSYASSLDLIGVKLRHTNTYGSSGQDSGVALYTVNDERLINIDVQWNGGTGVTLRGSSQMLNCTANNNGGNGVAGQGAGFAINGGAYNSNFWRGYTTGSAAGIKVITNVPTIYGNIQNIESAYNAGIGVWYDTVYQNSSVQLVTGNYIHDNAGSGIFLEASRNFVVANNVITGNKASAISLNATENAKIFNNTIVGNYGLAAIEMNGGTRAQSSAFPGTTGLKNNVIANNIIANNYSPYEIDIPQLSTDPNVGNNTSDYNLFYRRGGALQFTRGGTYVATWGQTITALTDWQSISGQDTHSVAADPRFVGGAGVAGNAIGSDSPARDTGTSLVEVTADRIGTARPTGPAYDMGAYEYISGGPGIALASYVNTDPTVWLDDTLPQNSTPTQPDSSGNNGVNKFWAWTNQTASTGLVALDTGNYAIPHKQYIQGLPAKAVSSQDRLFTWAYIDPAAPPSEIMIEYKDASGSWEHRAYWGVNVLPGGTDGTTSRRLEGDLPASRKWTCLSVLPADVGLSGGQVTGISFYLASGRAFFDRTGSGTPTVAGASRTAPTVLSFQVNDGSSQRSMVRSLALTFDQAVTLGAGALSLLRRSTTGGAPTSVPFQLTLSTGTVASYVLAFSGSSGASLADGVYDLTLNGQEISNTANQLMGNSSVTYTFHRLFGDIDGNKAVNNGDYLQFKKVFGSTTGSTSYVDGFDYDANGVINNADYLAFKNNFGLSYSY